MDKILSKDTIKNVFSALGAKTSDSNYGVALLDKTSGEPKGFMGMSDLASVLVVIPFNWGNITSLDDIKVTSVWRAGGISVTTNANTYNNTYGICLTLRSGGTNNWYLFQMYFTIAEYKLFVRGKSSSSDTIDWTDTAWKEVAFA